uniref:Uncharacterized protein n=1 Tax=Sphaerodactylus townsendi TaxID=933632 RepID=A0ACB8FHR6_9SAUR
MESSDEPFLSDGNNAFDLPPQHPMASVCLTDCPAGVLGAMKTQNKKNMLLKDMQRGSQKSCKTPLDAASLACQDHQVPWPWLTKAARKPTAPSTNMEPDQDTQEVPLSDGKKEEGEFSSEEEEESKADPSPPHIVSVDDFQYLLSKAIMTLGLSEEHDCSTDEKELKFKPKGPKEFFPRSTCTDKVSPFLEYFDTTVRVEWQNLMADKQPPVFTKKLYCLNKQAMEMLESPLVDVPVVALQSSDLFSVDGRGNVRDPLDRKVEFATKNAMKPQP